MKDEAPLAAVLQALAFAAVKHRDQRRKGAGAPPFINHAIEVAEILARVAHVGDPVTLQAAVLHDTLEDTDTTFEELSGEFGEEVAEVVQEVSDDKALSRPDRRQRQVEDAPQLSERARLIRIADKVANVRAVASAPPVDWSPERRLDYLYWTDKVVSGCRNPAVSAPLEKLYDETLQDGLRVVRRLTR